MASINSEIYCVAVIFVLLLEVKTQNFTDRNEIEYPEINSYYLSGCYNASAGSKGFVQFMMHPENYTSSAVCEWNIDVPKGSIVELDFEVFRLPISSENHCDPGIEISYSLSQDEVVKRHVCAGDTVDKISTGSHSVHILFKSRAYPVDHQNSTYGFKINYRAVAVNKPGGSYVVTVVLLSFTAILIIARISCCLGSCRKPSSNANADVPQSEAREQPSNAPTRSALQSAFERQRDVLQAPQIEKKYLPFIIFQSRTSRVNSEAVSERTFQNHPPHALISNLQEKPKISISSTPHVPVKTQKWSSESIRRIQNLRTRLVARFSIHSSSSDSVFFEMPDRRSYSKLSCQGSPEEPTAPEREGEIFRPDPKLIPSVVIELVD